MNKLFWGIALAAVIASGLHAETKTYDRYGLYGVGHPAGGHLLGQPDDYEDMVWRRMAEAGATSSRQAASWREIEAVKGQYDWSQIEGTLKYCREYPQIRPYILVVNTPGWAREDGQPSHLPPVPSAIPDWKKFCTELAKQYKGYAAHYEIWNEQNGFGWEAPPFHQIDKYLPIYKAAYEGLKAGDPDCKVSTGGLDNAGGYSPIEAKGYYDARYKKTYGELNWDAFGDHPYGDAKSMIEKLRMIRGIAAGYNDGDIELWLTEYGFPLAGTTKESQAQAVTDYMTTLITDPEFRSVTETNYLCVADFETGARFGLCDVNLRPRPAFYAYQRLPRPGQIVISDIHVKNESPTSVTVTWKTDRSTVSFLAFGAAEGKYGPVRRISKAGKAHSMTLTGLKPNTTYHYMISATAARFPEAKSLDYAFTTLAANGLRNPGFEDGFSVQIADHWECVGENLCWDSARLDGDRKKAHSGKSAQAIVSYDKGKSLDDYVIGQAPAKAGTKYAFSAWTCGVGSIERRVGIDPTGGTDPASKKIIWSDASSARDQWERRTVSASAQNNVITVFIHGKSTQSPGERDYFYADDAELAVE